MIMKKICVIISLILLITGCSHISTASYQEFNANEIIKKNELYRDDIPILVLLQNDNSSLITIVSQGVKKDTYYFRLDTDINYNILMKDNIIYIQNNKNCYMLQKDGSLLKQEDLITEYNVITPIISENMNNYYCYSSDCSISELDERYKTEYELKFSEDFFNYQDYKLVSFVRLCNYLT